MLRESDATRHILWSFAKAQRRGRFVSARVHSRLPSCLQHGDYLQKSCMAPTKSVKAGTLHVDRHEDGLHTGAAAGTGADQNEASHEVRSLKRGLLGDKA